MAALKGRPTSDLAAAALKGRPTFDPTAALKGCPTHDPPYIQPTQPAIGISN
jgi:hypothetical protein